MKMNKEGIYTTIIPFDSKTTAILDKTLKNPITISQIELKGDLSTTDKTTLLFGARSEDRYGTFIMYPDETVKQIKVTPAYNENRVGFLLLVYHGYPLSGITYVGSDKDLVQLIARGRSVLAGHGQNDVATAGTRVQLTTTKTRVVEIRAKKTNTGKIYVGDNTVTSSNGYILEADQPVQLPVDASILYIDASVNGEGVSWIGWK